ncbi:MAG: hypothetical protein J3K34DRAFT_35724 [Monoraphidium minutum]|nr:MAG: hypothetical protein J3K34DRAFT_35724 [Monoraphidium minutum]
MQQRASRPQARPAMACTPHADRPVHTAAHLAHGSWGQGCGRRALLGARERQSSRVSGRRVGHCSRSARDEAARAGWSVFCSLAASSAGGASVARCRAFLCRFGWAPCCQRAALINSCYAVISCLPPATCLAMLPSLLLVSCARVRVFGSNTSNAQTLQSQVLGHAPSAPARQPRAGVRRARAPRRARGRASAVGAGGPGGSAKAARPRRRSE